METKKINKFLTTAGQMAKPRLEKIVINTGIGKYREEKDQEFIRKHLELIAGQKPSARVIKKSIAGFKARKGMIVGYKITLRKKRMVDFLKKLIKITMARTRDFQGIKQGSVDKNGGLTIGVPEHIVFPEISDEETKNIFGLEIAFAPKTKKREDAIELYKSLGIPFRKTL